MSRTEYERRALVRYTVNPAALWFSAIGIAIQIVSMVLGSKIFGTGYLDLTSLVYTSVPILASVAALYWIRSRDVGLIKFGAILLFISALMPFTTLWGFFFGSAFMIGGTVTALATIRRKTLVTEWTNIINP